MAERKRKQEKGKGQDKGKEAREEPQVISWKHAIVPVLDQGRLEKNPVEDTKTSTETSIPSESRSDEAPAEGACWAMSTVTLVSLQHLIEIIQKGMKTSQRKPHYPSFQHIVNHCTTNTNEKVYGKTMEEVVQVLKYIKDKGLCFNRDYVTIRHLPGPPIKRLGASIPETSKIFITDYVALRRNETDFDTIKKILESHVLLGRIETHESFVKFKPGAIYTEHTGKKLRPHCIVIVGCGSEGGVDYYELQNSWGTTWGDGGFAKVKFDLVRPFAYVEGIFEKKK